MQKSREEISKCTYCGRPIRRGAACRAPQCQLQSMITEQTRDSVFQEETKSRKRRQNLFKDKRKAKIY